MLDPASAPNYVNNKDIRYENGNVVDLFMLNRASNGTVTWVQSYQRTLKDAV